MSAALHLAGPADFDRLLPLVERFHEEMEIEQTDAGRRAALLPLLEGNPYGSAYLIGPARAPIGYIVVTFTWSVEFGGLDGLIDEFYVRPGVRGRGIATEVLQTLPRALAGAGLNAMHLEVDRENTVAQRLYERCGFKRNDQHMLMTRPLS